MSRAKRSETTTQKFVFMSGLNTNQDTLTYQLIDLSATSAGLGAISGQLSYFLDMYRFVKMEHFTLEVIQVQNQAASAWNGWVISYSQAGASAPSDLTNIETEHSAIGGTLTGGAAKAKLDMTAKDFAVVAEAGGPSPGFLTTQGDGGTSTWGSIRITSSQSAGASASAATFVWRVVATMTFNLLVDPAEISLRMKSRLPSSLGNQTNLGTAYAEPASAQSGCKSCRGCCGASHDKLGKPG